MGTTPSKDESSSQSQQSEEERAHVPQSQSRGPRATVEAEAADLVVVEKPKEEAKPLPHNHEAILRDADSPVDLSNPSKLHDQLCNGVFLRHKKKKYWVDKRSNSNCFMAMARDLKITWSEDRNYWNWQSFKATPSDESTEVVELIKVCWLEVHGKIQTANLTPGVLYEAAFVVMLKDPAFGWDVPVNFRLVLPTGDRQERKECLMLQPRHRWIEIFAGEFMASPESSGGMEISMFEYEGGVWKKGLLIKGIMVRPKN